jgi:Arc/MetJ family transcription regulator
MRKHTTIDLDAELVREAADVLGTTRTTDTVHAALAEVVRLRRRMKVLDLDLDLTLADLDAIRGHRFAERPASYGSETPGAAGTSRRRRSG